MPSNLIPMGARNVDQRLSGGLAKGALHEVYGDENDAAAVSGFACMIALRAAGTKPILIVRDDRCVQTLGRIYPFGVIALGGDPASIYVVHTIDSTATLRAANEAIACAAVGSVIIEPWRAASACDLTASRRIALRAQRSGVLALIARSGTVVPSAATTRWRVRSAPSLALHANAPGRPVFDITLSRHRGGVAGFSALVEWNCDLRNFRDAPLPCAVPAPAVRGARNTGERRAA